MKKAPRKFESKRLVIKAFRMKDVNRIFNVYASNVEATKFISWPRHKNAEETLIFLADKLSKANHGEHTFGVFRKFDDQLIGSSVFKDTNGRVELGYIIGPEFWGEGYATEVVELMVDWIKEQPSVFRLWANCDVENIASHRVLEKAGFEKEGIAKDWASFPNQQGQVKDCIFYNYTLVNPWLPKP